MSKKAPASPTPSSLALLIDADNTPADLVPAIMKQVEAIGLPTIRRVHGNEETLRSQRWKDLCLQYALQPVLHLGITGVKNATDIALTVDAMDLLYKESPTSFCLVTGDQDFTALVLRLRSQGYAVYCIGRPSKADALTKVCTQFLSLEQFAPSASSSKKTAKAGTKEAKAVSSAPLKTGTSHLDQALTELLTTTVTNLGKEKQLEWISLSLLGSTLKRLNPKFQAKTYGYKHLPELVKTRTDLLEIRKQGTHLEVRLKPEVLPEPPSS